MSCVSIADKLWNNSKCWSIYIRQSICRIFAEIPPGELIHASHHLFVSKPLPWQLIILFWCRAGKAISSGIVGGGGKRIRVGEQQHVVRGRTIPCKCSCLSVLFRLFYRTFPSSVVSFLPRSFLFHFTPRFGFYSISKVLRV